MIYRCFGRFCDALHQFFLCNAPHIRGTFYGVDHSFADTSVCTADTNVPVGSAETTHGMSFEMCQDKHGIINNFIIDPEIRLRSISFCKKVNFGVLSPSELCFPVLRLLLVSGYVRPFLHSDICGHFPRKPVLSWRKLESFLHLRGPARGLP